MPDLARLHDISLDYENEIAESIVTLLIIEFARNLSKIIY